MASSRAQFEHTRWSVVLRTRADGPEAAQALEEVCQCYWAPLYAYARRWGHSPEDAEDLVQGFFLSALRRQLFAGADPALGRLRNLLLSAFKRHLQDSHAHAGAARRNPGTATLRRDYEEVERRARESAQRAGAPEHWYDREWAHSVLALAMEALHQRYRAEGKEALFTALSGRITAPDSETPPSELAESLSMTPSALAVALHRMRKRYRESLRETIRGTVQSDAEIDGELAELGRILTGS